MTVSIHATPGWALVISLHQSMALPTQPRRQGGKAGESRQLSLPRSVTLSPFLPAHLCLALSFKLSPLWRLRFLIVPLHNLWLSASLHCSPPLCEFHPRWRETSESHLHVRLPLPPSSVCMQTRPRRWSADTSCPERSSGCQFPPKPRQSALSHFAQMPPKFPLPAGLTFSCLWQFRNLFHLNPYS